MQYMTPQRLAILVLLVCSVHGAEAQQQSPYLPNAQVQARMDSLLRLALNSPDHDTQMRAALGIASAGRTGFHFEAGAADPPAEVRYPGVVARLEAIYTATSDVLLKDYIVGMMVSQSEKDDAIRFLTGVAERKSPGLGPMDRPIPAAAIVALSRMGSSGRAALQQLAARDGVKDPLARVKLERIKSRNWEVEPPPDSE